MNHARIATSPRLQRVLAVLAEGGEYTTRDLVVGAAVCAVNSCIAELRANGVEISCVQRVAPTGVRRWYYRLISAPRDLVGSI